MNIAVLIGRLTRDPELRYIPSTGKAVANFAIAVDRPYTSKSGERSTVFSFTSPNLSTISTLIVSLDEDSLSAILTS